MKDGAKNICKFFGVCFLDNENCTDSCSWFDECVAGGEPSSGDRPLPGGTSTKAPAISLGGTFEEEFGKRVFGVDTNESV